jgi:hypothetical protein
LVACPQQFSPSTQGTRLFYFTLELVNEKDIENAYRAGKQMGLPVVYGEWVHEGSYHYYPSLEQVKDWVHKRSSF